MLTSIATMAEELQPLHDRRIAAMINDAKVCGIEMVGLDSALFDYFAVQHEDPENSDSDGKQNYK